MPLLYDAAMPAPNPRRVRMFLAEKGISIPTKLLSIVGGEHKAPDFTSKYSPGQLPVLELDDGRMIGESVSICRYFEALHPEHHCLAQARSKLPKLICGSGAWK
jgi:glutathione S-transferase